MRGVRVEAVLAQASLLVCLVGLIRSGRWRLCYTLPLYILAIVGLGGLTTWGPDFFRSWDYWLWKQHAYDAVKLALPVELSARVCHNFPGARSRLERWLLAVLLLTAAGILLVPYGSDVLLTAAGDLHARVAVGALWLLLATLVAVHRYRIAAHPHHMGLIVGFGVYLAVWGMLLRLLFVRGWSAHALFNALEPPVYVAFAVWLAWVAWRPARSATEDYEAVAALLRERTA